MFNSILDGVAVVCARVKTIETKATDWIAAHPRLTLSLAALSIIVAVIL